MTPATAAELVDCLRLKGFSIRLTRSGETFTIRPKKNLTPTLRKALTALRADVIAVLRGERVMAPRARDDTRPPIDAGIGDLQRLGTETWKIVCSVNSPPRLFRREGRLVRVVPNDDGHLVIRELDAAALTHYLAEIAYWRVERVRDNGSVEVEVPPPVRTVRDLLAHPDPPVPVLTRIVCTPFFTPTGELHATPGYSDTSRSIYAPRPGFVVPPVPPRPSLEDVRHARELLCEVFGDFPLVDESDLAHALALVLTVFVRDLIAGPVPLILLEKPSPGTGASLLADAAFLLATGRAGASLPDAGEDEAEWRKLITATLRDGPSVVFIDNVHHRLQSRHLARALTSTLWQDRLLGVSEEVVLPNRAVWAATGNNITVSLEIARRCLRVRLDAGLERPWLRAPQEFRHPDLLAWIRDERSKLVWAALTIVQTWIAAGRQPGAGTLGMFEDYVAVVGGILAQAGIPGFLGDIEAIYEAADDESEEVRRFLRAWWAELGDKSALVARLYSIATAEDVNFPLNGKDDTARRVSLGRRLRKLLGRPHEIDTNLTVKIAKGEAADVKARAGLWQLLKHYPGSRGPRGPRGSQANSEPVSDVRPEQKYPNRPADGLDNLSELSDLSAAEATWRCPCGTVNRAADQLCEVCGGGHPPAPSAEA